ncbi:MAG: 4-hydroxythreonine-4-phosphate dehydrogenase PdxA [Hymenobacteraceae bacterium]|nr:4-hydroxythreonine-4-phosphate dehydrogenase PdxA [Hymenobacteraceae bacterium]MDX5396615.1 4-hydroxythreonine-4-phosphate dehydrogenase PdxA [Hymenobacteraceae bacterium]MDX5512677.1 4-hydroxythreonine-4-phosphate dehydrogenase PdxA [Hymenobacteraceae bacterium]
MDHQKAKIRLGISLGDFNGIGPEVIIKTFSDNRLLNFCTPVIYGSTGIIGKYRKLLNAEHFNYQAVASAENLQYKRINIINCWEDDFAITPGKPMPESGQGALKSLQKAAEDLKAGLIDAIVTAPIDKNNIQSEAFAFPGHTEFFTSYFGAPDSLMLLVGGSLRVATLTGHIAIKEVAAAITPERLEQKLNILFKSLKQDFGIKKPRVAVLGLNPHAGEKGLLGQEEAEIIRPVIKARKEKGELIFGPYPADGFFGTQQHKKFDAILAMYHDQGLIPFKTLAFENGVNFTAGLPIVRTSPDHGTAYDIAGKNQADETSFREAVFAAIDIARKRADI